MVMRFIKGKARGEYIINHLTRALRQDSAKTQQIVLKTLDPELAEDHSHNQISC